MFKELYRLYSNGNFFKGIKYAQFFFVGARVPSPLVATNAVTEFARVREISNLIGAFC